MIKRRCNAFSHKHRWQIPLEHLDVRDSCRVYFPISSFSCSFYFAFTMAGRALYSNNKYWYWTEESIVVELSFSFLLLWGIHFISLTWYIRDRKYSVRSFANHQHVDDTGWSQSFFWCGHCAWNSQQMAVVFSLLYHQVLILMSVHSKWIRYQYISIQPLQTMVGHENTLKVCTDPRM